MFLLRLPLNRWLIRQHALAVAGVIGVAALVCWWYLHVAAENLSALKQERAAVQRQLLAAQAASPLAVQPSLLQALPNIARADEVARDIGRFAQPVGVQISSLAVETHAGTATELAKVHFNLSAQANYMASKAWLAELLGRYPTLAVQSLSIRASANEAPTQELRLGLVLWVKD
jgi:hypothetical protein